LLVGLGGWDGVAGLVGVGVVGGDVVGGDVVGGDVVCGAVVGALGLGVVGAGLGSGDMLIVMVMDDDMGDGPALDVPATCTVGDTVEVTDSGSGRTEMAGDADEADAATAVGASAPPE
jgi:hypothetical protein